MRVEDVRRGSKIPTPERTKVMKNTTKWFLLIVISGLLLGAGSQPSSAQTPCVATPGCTCTSFVDPETNATLNAFLINPPNEVLGAVVAPSCNIVVYFNTGQGQVGDKKAPQTDLSGATHYGVLVDGSVNEVAVDVTNTAVHNIKSTIYPNSDQGIGISYRAFQTTAVGTAGGTVSNCNVYDYEKGGIEANGQGVNVTIRENTVTGMGPDTFQAQNGIQVGFGANASATGNTVSNNTVHNPDDTFFAATGVLVTGGPFWNGSAACPGSTSTNPCPYTTGTMVLKNTLTNNDVGAYLYNPLSDGNTPPAKDNQTNNKVVNNTMSISSCSNVYMTGATDIGYNDKVINNNMTGYNVPGTCFPVDNGGTATKVHVSPHK
jgi:hypothetical protein